ncbi:MAG: hypothetical protein IT438_15845, partial [Phycisphaerales bacterium]|nr:hypothetical protein [Phycisphaerales bacterium]
MAPRRMARGAWAVALSLCVGAAGVVEHAEAQAGCRCDWNKSGALSVQDIFDFLASYFAGSGDFNCSGAVSPQDLFDFLACYFSGCASYRGDANPNSSTEPEPAATAATACAATGMQARSPRGVENVQLFSGEVIESATDMRTRGRGLDFIWARRYRSQLGASTAMGNGWDYSYNIFLERCAPNIKVHNG